MDVQERAERAIEQIRGRALAAPATIRFGSCKLNLFLTEALSAYAGKRALVALGRQSARASGLMDILEASLKSARIASSYFPGIHREPTASLIDEGAAFARQSRPDVIIGAGGGSVMDAAKAIAAMAVNDGSVEDYLEGVGSGRVLSCSPLPVIAIPTTSGTGAEMTKNAVICSLEKKYKKSMRDIRMIPRAALLDPSLARSVPRAPTAAGGLDTITQLIEVCISRKKQPATTALALDALPHTVHALTDACEQPDHRHAREQLAYAGFVSGVCLANAGLGMAHGIAAGLGALFDMPHGLACGLLLPHTLDYLLPACGEVLRAPLAHLQDMTFGDDETVVKGISMLHRLNKQLGIPRDLKHLYLKADDVRHLAEASMGSSLSACPIDLNIGMVHQFLKRLA